MNVRRKIEAECAYLEDLCAQANTHWEARSWPDIDEASNFLCHWLQTMKRKNWLLELLQSQGLDP